MLFNFILLIAKEGVLKSIGFVLAIFIFNLPETCASVGCIDGIFFTADFRG